MDLCEVFISKVYHDNIRSNATAAYQVLYTRQKRSETSALKTFISHQVGLTEQVPLAPSGLDSPHLKTFELKLNYSHHHRQKKDTPTHSLAESLSLPPPGAWRSSHWVGWMAARRPPGTLGLQPEKQADDVSRSC
ncbi:hypothetical protein INR49_018550 [Caranx melampygus]|nr:hypothetical protein INR49_018550 [Caranx melampygus]